MIRHLVMLALFLTLLPAEPSAEDGMFPEAPLDCIVRPQGTTELSSEEEGVLAEILVDRGEAVRRGQVVARLDNRLQESAVDLARIRAESDDAVAAGRARVNFRQEEFSRMTELHSKNVTSAASLDETAVQLRLAELELKTAATEKRIAEAELDQALLRLDRREIRSPIDGIVVRITASPGEFAHEAAPVMTIAELDPLHVEAYLPIELYPETAMGQEAEITIGAPINAQRTATVSAIDKIFDAASGTFGVRLDLPNADHHLPGGIKCGMRFHVQAASSNEAE